MVPFFFEEVLLGQGCWLFGLFPFFAHSKSGQSPWFTWRCPLDLDWFWKEVSGLPVR